MWDREEQPEHLDLRDFLVFKASQVDQGNRDSLDHPVPLVQEDSQDFQV